jgi:hypothetical protein
LSTEKTIHQYQEVISECKSLFMKKNADYGTSWRIMRPSSITDQIFIKAQRIRSIEEKGTQKVQDPIADEFVGIINYCIIGLILLHNPDIVGDEIALDLLESKYQEEVNTTMQLMLNKNHDYGEAWRSMRISTFTDLILTKILRTKEIESNHGKTIISEGIDANYRDMMNYAIFASIRLNENK